MTKRKKKDGDGDGKDSSYSVVKIPFSKVACNYQLAKHIELQVKKMTVLAYHTSRLANLFLRRFCESTESERSESGATLSINDQMWWYNMIKNSGETDRNVKESAFGGDIMKRCKEDLSTKFEPVNVTGISLTCNALARDMKTVAVNTTVQNFHDDLLKYVASIIDFEVFKFRFSDSNNVLPAPVYKTKYSRSSFVRRASDWLLDPDRVVESIKPATPPIDLFEGNKDLEGTIEKVVRGKRQEWLVNYHDKIQQNHMKIEGVVKNVEICDRLQTKRVKTTSTSKRGDLTYVQLTITTKGGDVFSAYLPSKKRKELLNDKLVKETDEKMRLVEQLLGKKSFFVPGASGKATSVSIETYERKLTCIPTIDFIQDVDIPILLHWMFDIENTKGEYVNIVKEKLKKLVDQNFITKDVANWYSYFPRRVMRKRKLLPEYNFNPNHITLEGFDTIFELIKGAFPDKQLSIARATKDSTKEEWVKNQIDTLMPGIVKLKCMRNQGVKFAYKLKTDGVFASLVFTRTGAVTIDTNTTRANAKEDKAVDMASPTPPILPSRRDTLWSIDPGKRDMIVAVNMFPSEGEERIVKMSARQHFRECKRGKNKRKTESAMYREKLMRMDDSGKRVNLFAQISGPNAPSGKTTSSSQYTDYISATVADSIDEKIMSLKMSKQWRLRRGWLFALRDKSLDKLCNRMTKKQGKQGGNDKGTTLIAFGAANVSSTGMGYGCAPQQRLRYRLQVVHGARLTLIDEFRTSKLLRSTNVEMKTPLKRKPTNAPSGWWKKTENTMYGVLVAHVGKRKVFVHRDVNAAHNIGDIYMSLARYGKRPKRFTRGK